MYLHVVLESVMGIWCLNGHGFGIGLRFDEAPVMITVAGKIALFPSVSNLSL
jgi:hypothetical protein